MPQGKITNYWTERCYGFLSDSTTNEELFFHLSDIDPRIPPTVGNVYSYDLGEFNGKKKAANLRLGTLSGGV